MCVFKSLFFYLFAFTMQTFLPLVSCRFDPKWISNGLRTCSDAQASNIDHAYLQMSTKCSEAGIHPGLCCRFLCTRGCGSYRSRGEGDFTPCFITGKTIKPFTHSHSHHTSSSLGCAGTHTDSGRTCRLLTERSQCGNQTRSSPSCSEVTAQTAGPAPVFETELH